MTDFTVGNRVRFEGRFRDGNGQPSDPAAVTATITQGNRSETFKLGAGIERSRAGVFGIDYTIPMAGPIDVRFETDGEGFSARTFEVSPAAADDSSSTYDGTPAYMVPEQLDVVHADDDDEIDHTDDADDGRADMIERLAARGHDRRELARKPTAFLVGLDEALEASVPTRAARVVARIRTTKVGNSRARYLNRQRP